jgi:hypothetical protein
MRQFLILCKKKPADSGDQSDPGAQALVSLGGGWGVDPSSGNFGSTYRRPLILHPRIRVLAPHRGEFVAWHQPAQRPHRGAPDQR